MTTSKRSGFEPLPESMKMCRHPQHGPPSHLYIPPDQQYRHVCPSCGKEFVLTPTNISMRVHP